MLKKRRKMQIASSAMEGPAYGKEGMALGELHALGCVPDTCGSGASFLQPGGRCKGRNSRPTVVTGQVHTILVTLTHSFGLYGFHTWLLFTPLLSTGIPSGRF